MDRDQGPWAVRLMTGAVTSAPPKRQPPKSPCNSILDPRSGSQNPSVCLCPCPSLPLSLSFSLSSSDLTRNRGGNLTDVLFVPDFVFLSDWSNTKDCSRLLFQLGRWVKAFLSESYIYVSISSVAGAPNKNKGARSLRNSIALSADGSLKRRDDKIETNLSDLSKSKGCSRKGCRRVDGKGGGVKKEGVMCLAGQLLGINKGKIVEGST